MAKIGLINEREKPKKICSIDASTNSLAFAIFDSVSLEAVGKIRFTGNTNYEKVADAAKKTFALFKHFEVDAIIIEHTVFINSPKTAADLALVQGALLGAASMNGIRIAGSINPITWQTFINNGKFTSAEKQQLQKEYPGKSVSWYKTKERELRKQKTIKFVNIYYDRNLTDDDVADAVGIGHYAINNWGKVDKG
jgi:Holliday junction resolvasome RuvABC endonuclease subunit